MKHHRQFHQLRRLIVLTIALLASLHSTATAQSLKDIQPPKTPLVLKEQGSFFVGGEKIEQTHVELGSFGPAGHISVNQMYVRYMVPVGGERKTPVVMVHGMTLRNYLKTPGVNKMLWLSKLTFRLTLNSRVSARPAGMRTRTDDRIGEERQQPGSR